MPNRLTLRPDLDALVADRFVQPVVRRVTDDVADALRRNAPAARLWLSVRDDRVRSQHVDADGQVIPANLRFHLPAADHGPAELARAPRDPDLRIANRIACRCVDLTLGQEIRARVRADPVEVVGTRVRASAHVTYPRIVESEFPTAPDTGGGWAQAAAREVAARTPGVRVTRA